MANPNQEIKYTKLFINNRFVESKSGKTFHTINPATGKLLASISEGDKADVDLAVEAALNAVHRGAPWRVLDASKRGQLLHRLADLFKRDINVLANLETLDTGKPFHSSLRDVNHAIDTLRYYAGYADKIYGRTIPSDGYNLMTYTRKEPVGVVAHILSYDHPLAILTWKWGPALAAGCTVVTKPSSKTPLTALYAASLSHEVGFPEGVINVITGYGQTVGQTIGSHHDIRHVSFTGKTEIGRNIMELAARSNLKKTSLHLGGNSALVILNDADIEGAALIAHRATFTNQGQSASASRRVYVQENVYDQFIKHSVELARKRIVGNPFDKGVRQGPLIDDKLLEHVLEYIETAKRSGAKLEVGGKRAGNNGFFLEPTIFSNVTNDMKIVKDEVFGPIQLVMRFKTLDEIIEKVNRSPYGLAAGVVTAHLDKAMYLTRRFDTGTVWINTWNAFVPQAPYGGFKESGHGRDLGWAAIKQYLETKTVSVQLSTQEIRD